MVGREAAAGRTFTMVSFVGFTALERQFWTVDRYQRTVPSDGVRLNAFVDYKGMFGKYGYGVFYHKVKDGVLTEKGYMRGIVTKDQDQLDVFLKALGNVCQEITDCNNIVCYTDDSELVTVFKSPEKELTSVQRDLFRKIEKLTDQSNVERFICERSDGKLPVAKCLEKATTQAAQAVKSGSDTG